MSKKIETNRRAITAFAVAGLWLANVNLIMAQDAVTPGKPADTIGLLPPRPISNDRFHVDETIGTIATQRPNLTKAGTLIDDLAPGSFEAVENGYRRVHRTETHTLTAQQIAELQAERPGGVKSDQRVLNTFTDHLPTNWMFGAENPADGQRVDSMGNPIVNMAQGLPDWAQRDVDGLRGAIAGRRLHLANLELALAGHADQIAQFPPRADATTYQRSAEDLMSDRMEAAHSLGNLVGQSIARGIEIADILGLNDAVMTPEAVQSAATYLHFYESEKMRAAADAEPSAQYVQSSYAPHVTAWFAANGHSMQDVLTVVPADEGGIAGAGGCYNVSALTVGWTELTAATIIWDGSVATYDFVSADVPIGFRFYYAPCEDLDDNFNVRVSTKGYLSFFEQGGGALDGTDSTNDILPSATDPDGIVAPWWDDLIVTDQGTIDTVSYKTEGSAGSRVFTVEWNSVSRFGGDTTEFHYFQAKLFENDGQVRFNYDTLWIADSADNATCGIEDFAGDDADCGPNCDNTNATEPVNNYLFDYPAPSNNFCSSAICIEEDEELFGSTFGSSGSELSSCAGTNDFADVWYSYTAGAGGSTTVTLCTGGNQYDTSLSVFSGTCAAPVEVVCDDDFCAGFGPSEVTFAATDGVTYLIRVSGFNGARGTFRVSVDAGTTGDVCQNAWPLSIPGTGVGNYFTTNNTGCDDDTTCAGGDVIDEWFDWTAPVSGVVRASTCIGDTDFDTTLAVFTGTCGLLTQRACNDDATPYCNGELTSRVLWVADAGVTYHLRVAGFSGATGNYDIALGYHNCPADIAPLDAGDGLVDIDDLLAVIGGWGACVSCRADFVPAGGNNVINIDDLLGVIGAWGSCP